MKTVEKSARTVDEAVALALEELGVPSDRVRVEVLEEAKGGFLGLIGGKHAVVRVTLKENRPEKAEEYFRTVCRAIGVDVLVAVREEGEYIHVDVTGPEAGILIGHHGQTLEALQYLANLAVARMSDEGGRVLLDVEGYRKRREETLTRLANRVADRVKRTGETVTLEPMSAQERRVIHLALQDDPEVTTSSEGEEPFRRVVIQPKR
jgi:spoIIIJ-associated protein